MRTPPQLSQVVPGASSRANENVSGGQNRTSGRRDATRLTNVNIVSSLVPKRRTVLLDLTRKGCSTVDEDLRVQPAKGARSVQARGVDSSGKSPENAKSERTVGLLYLAQAIIAPGIFLSQPGISTPASYWKQRVKREGRGGGGWRERGQRAPGVDHAPKDRLT